MGCVGMKKYFVCIYFVMSSVHASEERVVVRPTFEQRQAFKWRYSNFQVFVRNKCLSRTVPTKVMQSYMLHEAQENKKMSEDLKIMYEGLQGVLEIVKKRDKLHFKEMDCMYAKMLEMSKQIDGKPKG